MTAKTHIKDHSQDPSQTRSLGPPPKGSPKNEDLFINRIYDIQNLIHQIKKNYILYTKTKKLYKRIKRLSKSGPHQNPPKKGSGQAFTQGPKNGQNSTFFINFIKLNIIFYK